MSEPFKIETMDDLRNVLISAQGGDPEAQQTLNAFLHFNSNIERTNLPTRKDVVLIAYLDSCGKFFYPDDESNPFTMLADSLSICFMAKGGQEQAVCRTDETDPQSRRFRVNRNAETR